MSALSARLAHDLSAHIPSRFSGVVFYAATAHEPDTLRLTRHGIDVYLYCDTTWHGRVIDLSHPSEPIRQVFHYLDLPIDASTSTVVAYLVADVPRRIDALR